MKPKSLILVISILLITACSDGSSQFIGTWQNPNHKSEKLELRKDGTFISSNGRHELQGYWDNYKEGHITIAIMSKVDGNFLDARYDEKTKELIITIAGDNVVMQRVNLLE